MSFTAVTPEQIKQVEAEPGRWYEIEENAHRDSGDNGELSCYLDKAWHGLSFLLDAADMPLNLELDVDDVLDPEAGLCAWSVEEVRAAAEHLLATPFERLADHFDPKEMTHQNIYPSMIWERDGAEALDYLREHYQYLVHFFDAATRAGAAAIQSQG